MQRRTFLSSLAALPFLRELFNQSPDTVEPRAIVSGLWDAPINREIRLAYASSDSFGIWFDPRTPNIPVIGDVVQINGASFVTHRKQLECYGGEMLMKVTFHSYNTRAYDEFLWGTSSLNREMRFKA